MAASITNQQPTWLVPAGINYHSTKNHEKYSRNAPLPSSLSVSSQNQSLNGSCLSTEDQEIVQRPFYSNKEFRGLQPNAVEIVMQQDSVQGCLSSSISEQQQVNEVYSGNGGGFFAREQHPECNNLDESKLKYIFKYSSQPICRQDEQERRDSRVSSVNSTSEAKQSQNSNNLWNQTIKPLISKSPQVEEISRNIVYPPKDSKNSLLVVFDDRLSGQRAISNEQYSKQSQLFFKSNLQNRRKSLEKNQSNIPHEALIDCQQDTGVLLRRKSMDMQQQTKVLQRRKSVEMIAKSNINRNDFVQNFQNHKGDASSSAVAAIVTPNQNSNRNNDSNPSGDKGMAYKYYKRISEYVSDHKNIPSVQSSNQSTTKKIKQSTESNQHSFITTAQKQTNDINRKTDKNKQQKQILKQQKPSVLATKSMMSSAITSIKPSRRVSEALVNVPPVDKLIEHKNIDQNKENIPVNTATSDKYYEKSPQQSPYFLKKQKAQKSIEVKQITIGSLLVKAEDDRAKTELQKAENIVARQKAEDNLLLMKLYELQGEKGDRGVEDEIEEQENIEQEGEQLQGNNDGEGITDVMSQESLKQTLLKEGIMRNNITSNENVKQSQQINELSQNLHEESSSIYWDFSFVDKKQDKPELQPQRPHNIPRLELDQSKKPQNQLKNRNTFVENKPITKTQTNNRRKSGDQLGRREDTTTTEFKTKCLLKETSKHTNIIQERIQALQSTFQNQQQCFQRKKSQGKLLTMN